MPDLPILLHSGHRVPERLLATISDWPTDRVTPGWVTALPGSVAALCKRWDIHLDAELPETFITLVLPGHSGIAGPVVIKGSPLGDEFRAEVCALRLAAGEGVVRVLDVDPDGQVMLLERIVPGFQLRHVPLSDEVATRLAAELIHDFWQPVGDTAHLHPLRRWMSALLDRPDETGPIPQELVRDAQRLAETRLATSSETFLLHGDFQHHNVLRTGTDGWTIIDPKGLVGPRGFDIAAWMYNPPGVTSRADYRQLAERRIQIVADVWRIDERELAEWAFVGAVLSCCWSVSDVTPPDLAEYLLAGARTLRTFL